MLHKYHFRFFDTRRSSVTNTRLYSIRLTQRCKTFSQKVRIHHAIAKTSCVTCNKFHNEDQQILGATAIRCPGFVQPWSYVFRLPVVISSYSFTHSLCPLSSDRSTPSSTAISPHSAIQCFLLQFPVSSLFFRVIQ